MVKTETVDQWTDDRWYTTDKGQELCLVEEITTTRTPSTKTKTYRYYTTLEGAKQEHESMEAAEAWVAAHGCCLESGL